MKICYIIALHAEAQPLIDHYRMKKVEEAFSPLPCELYQNPDKPNLSVVLTGSDHERDLIGCEAACVTTMAAIQQLKPDLIISSGTCGGLKRYGGETGKVYISSGSSSMTAAFPMIMPGAHKVWATTQYGKVQRGSMKI